MEIVLNEICALNEIDFKTEREKAIQTADGYPDRHSGVCSRTELGTLVVTDYVIGWTIQPFLWCTCPTPAAGCSKCGREALASAIDANARFKEGFPYVAEHIQRWERFGKGGLRWCRCRKGLQYQAPVFRQWREKSIRIAPTAPQLDALLAAMDSGIPASRLRILRWNRAFCCISWCIGYRQGHLCRYRQAVWRSFMMIIRK